MLKNISTRLAKVSLLLSFGMVAVIYLKNAWVSDDAYILFRSIDQFMSGNGLVWNPHERVQVFTSVLWYFLLCGSYLVSKNMYLTVIVLSLVLLLLTLYFSGKIFRSFRQRLLLVLLFVSSGGFFDFTSSGLENVLAYLLIAIYLYNYVNIFSLNKPVSQQDLSALIKRIHLVALSFGLLLLVRHDLLTLFMIPTAYVLYSKFSLMSLKRWAGICLLAFMPLALWSLFSLIYYGVPLPNTAYAKLSTGISKLLLYKSGWFYILQSVKYDIITVFVIAVVIVASFAKSLAVEKHLRFLCLGILANIFYVVSVGGDFMLGRFFSYSYLVAVVLLLSILKKRESVYLGLALGFYAVFYFHTPLNSPLNYSDTSIRMGVADERGFYFKSSSLYRYFNISAKDVFPDMRWSYEGRQFKASPDKVVVKGNIGFFGYYAGLNKLIVDKHALSDPLLSKLPVAKGDSWRIGHFRREIPAGYLDSVKYGENLIADPNLHRYYDVIRVLTRQKKIITYNRLKTILLFNIGYYDHLIKPTSLAEGD